MPIPNPDHLLEQADRLTLAPAAGPPRQVDLRRAISAAYYALFHSIVCEVADEIVGKKHRTTPRYELVYRAADRSSLKRVCEELQKSTLSPKYGRYAPPGGFGADLMAVAAAVIELQEKRHAADYDPLLRVRTSMQFWPLPPLGRHWPG